MGRRSKWYELLRWLLGWYAEQFGLNAELKVFGCGLKRRGIRKTGGSTFMCIGPLVHAPNKPTRKQAPEGPRRAGGRRSPPGEKARALQRAGMWALRVPSDGKRAPESSGWEGARLQQGGVHGSGDAVRSEWEGTCPLRKVNNSGYYPFRTW